MRSTLKTILTASTFLATGAFAQEATVPAAEPNLTVTMTGQVRQYTLSDSADTDTFTMTLADARAKQTFTQTCTPGKSGAMAAISNYFRQDEQCAFSKGAWWVINPKNGQEVKVGDIVGSFTIQGAKDGLTNVNSIMLDPTRGGGTLPASGTLVMKPEDPSAELVAVTKKLAESFKGESAISTTETTDSVFYRDFMLPASGFPKEAACATDGSAFYIYDRGLWRFDVIISCGTDVYRLAGDMTWVDVEGQTDHTALYQLDLQVPQGDTDIFADYDPFAEVDGVKATIKMNGSDATTVAVTDKFSYDVDQKIDINGEFTGTNVSLEAVRTVAQLVAYLPRLNFGA